MEITWKIKETSPGTSMKTQLHQLFEVGWTELSAASEKATQPAPLSPHAPSLLKVKVVTHKIPSAAVRLLP